MNEKTELDKAINLVQENGLMVIKRLSLAAKPLIRELSDAVESAGYRLDEAKIERTENFKATGRILLTIIPFEVLEVKEREGEL